MIGFKDFYVPIYIKKSITPIKREVTSNSIVIGGDTETFEGEPFSQQYYHQKYEAFIWTDGKKTFKDFIHYCDTLPSGHKLNNYLIWFHNLNYDAISLFFPKKYLKILAEEEFEFEYGNYNIKGVYCSAICFITLRHKNNHKVIRLLDTFKFFIGSLAKLADLFCPHLPKLRAPKGLGTKIFNSNDKYFMDYSMRDSQVTENIGNYIQGLHNDYGVSQCVSLPHMVSKIFKKHFLKKEIPRPPKFIEFAALHSYHGGKNLLNVDKGLYENVYGLDIVSAYPDAMDKMPSFYEADLYYQYDDYDGGLVPDYGVYKVSGFLKTCKYPILYNHAFIAEYGEILDTWVTGFELNEAIKSDEIHIEKLTGYFYDEKQDTHISPLKEYTSHFFKMKSVEKDPIKRYFYKLALNSLYGKFIQKKEEKITDESHYKYDLKLKRLTTNKILRGGGLFHPFIASLITGYVRAKVHRIEHKYKTMHTATDGFISKIKCKDNDNLGGLKTEFQGDVLLLRNKLYIVYTENEKIAVKTNKGKPIKSKHLKEKFIQKYGLHGYNGDVLTLEDMYFTGYNTYEFTKVNKLKESLKQGLAVNKFEQRLKQSNF